MTRIQSDLVQVHVGPRHMRQAKMTWGMGGEVWQAHAKSQLLDNLRPGDQSQRMRGIAMRLRQKEGAASGGECASLLQVRFQKATRHLAIPNHALSSILGMLRSHSDLALGEVNITQFERHQLFAPQRSIVS